MSDSSAADAAKRRIKNQIDATVKVIAEQRDYLRDLIETAAEISDDCDEAIDDLERAADTLSRQL